MSENAPYVVFYAIVVVFVASALVGRRMRLAQAAKMGLAWLAIFMVAIAIAVMLRAYRLL